MDFRPYILAGTFLLVVVAFTTFIVAWVRYRRPAEPEMRRAGDTEVNHAPMRPLDTSLEGLEVTVSDDAPSASLLTPLRTGEWMPPERPAPVESLPAVSLAERVAEFQPAPEIREPSFAVPEYPAWEVAPEAEASTPAAGTVESPSWVKSVPEVVHAPEYLPTAGTSLSEDDDLSEQIAQLLPDKGGIGNATGPLEPDLDTLIQALSSESSTSDLDKVAALPAWQQPPEPPVLAEIPETVPALEKEPASEGVPDVELIVATVSEPAQEPEPEPAQEPEPEPAPQPAPGPMVTPAPTAGPPAEPEEAHPEWLDMLREQQGSKPPSPRPAAVAGPSSPRPAAVVNAQPPAPVDDAVPDPVPGRRRARPQVRVHRTEADEETPRQPGRRMAPLRAPAGSHAGKSGVGGRAGAIPDIVMEAPVEMWFGDSRVGVKEGTATYDRFRKYADVLFADLKAAEDQSR